MLFVINSVPQIQTFSKVDGQCVLERKKIHRAMMTRDY